jgi:hypothetical protein
VNLVEAIDASKVYPPRDRWSPGFRAVNGSASVCPAGTYRSALTTTRFLSCGSARGTVRPRRHAEHRYIGGRIESLPGRLLCYVEDGESALAAAHRLGRIPATALVRRSTLEAVFLAPSGRSLVD